MPTHARGGELNTTSHAAVMPLLALKSVINCGRSLRLLFTNSERAGQIVSENSAAQGI